MMNKIDAKTMDKRQNIQEVYNKVNNNSNLTAGMSLRKDKVYKSVGILPQCLNIQDMENILMQIKEGNIKDYLIVVKEVLSLNVVEDHVVDKN